MVGFLTGVVVGGGMGGWGGAVVVVVVRVGVVQWRWVGVGGPYLALKGPRISGPLPPIYEPSWFPKFGIGAPSLLTPMGGWPTQSKMGR